MEIWPYLVGGLPADSRRKIFKKSGFKTEGERPADSGRHTLVIYISKSAGVSLADYRCFTDSVFTPRHAGCPPVVCYLGSSIRPSILE